MHSQAVSYRDAQKIKILAYLSFLREVVIFTCNGKMIFLSVLCKYREADDNLKKRISSGDIYFCERHFVKGDIQFTSKIVSDFPLFFVLLYKSDIWLMSFKTLARYNFCITIHKT